MPLPLTMKRCGGREDVAAVRDDHGTSAAPAAGAVTETGSGQPGIGAGQAAFRIGEDAASFRIEHDSMGEVAVPADALWGAQTQRAVENFPVSGEPLASELVRALVSIKGAAATVNSELGVIPADMATAIHDAAAEIAAGNHLDQFPIDVFQTGSGTSSNMNANEVIATLATRRLGRKVHPNDHVNASQSSNDVFPSAIHIAACRLLAQSLLPALSRLAEALEAKAAEFADVVKSGRTHLMDATPVTLGQEFGGYAAAVRSGIRRLEALLPEVGELPLGGTAVGSGLNAPPGFAASVIAVLAADLELPLTEAGNHFEAAGGRDALVLASGALRSVAVSLYKICNDLRLMGSGPRTGLAEIAIPDLQPGSSIMPGKVNPVIPEVMCQVCAQVIGNDAAVAFGGAAGNFELNVMLPLIARNLLESIRLLAAAAGLLAEKCVSGIAANTERLRRYAESSPSIVTALNRFIGYEAAAAVAHQALETGQTIKETVIARGHVNRGEITEAQLDAALDVLAMARPAGTAR
jgi:fumarate hydratase class II